MNLISPEKIVEAMNNRAAIIVDSFNEFIAPGECFLSVGDGDGYVTSEVQSRCGIKGRGIDLKIDLPIPRAPDVPLDIYDGVNMPYGDNSFDVVAAIFVLHHCNDPVSVFSEMKRVTKKKIIIVEDTYRNWIEHLLVCIIDYIENKFFSKDMNIPLNFQTAQEWEKQFTEQGLNIKKSKRFHTYKLLPVRHQVFCLTL
jgi:ubiquinone/menaquinone biosynthesis C-methylase UbiE